MIGYPYNYNDLNCVHASQNRDVFAKKAFFITIIIIISVSVAFAEELVKVNNNVIIPVSVPSDDSKLRQQIAMNTCVLAGFQWKYPKSTMTLIAYGFFADWCAAKMSKL